VSKLPLILGACAAVIGVSLGTTLLRDRNLNCAPSAVAGGQAAIGGAFSLINQQGQRVTDKDVIKDLSLIYFGFTYCPDVCPLDTARNLEAVDKLTERGINVTPIFITIDPARDTPQVLADYAEVLHPNLIALTGTEAEIDGATKAYKSYRRKVGEGDSDYLMDHSTFSYLMSPDGLVEYFRNTVSAGDMADRIACFAT